MQSFVLLVLFLIPILVQAQSLEDIIIQQESEGVHWSISVIDEQGHSLESWNNLFLCVRVRVTRTRSRSHFLIIPASYKTRVVRGRPFVPF